MCCTNVSTLTEPSQFITCQFVCLYKENGIELIAFEMMNAIMSNRFDQYNTVGIV